MPITINDCVRCGNGADIDCADDQLYLSCEGNNCTSLFGMNALGVIEAWNKLNPKEENDADNDK